MFANIYWVAFGIVLAIGVFWLAMNWIKSPRESRSKRD